MLLLVQSAVLLAAAGSVLSFSAGPPAEVIVCNGISPNPTRHGASAQSGNGGYVIATNLPLDTGSGVYNYTAGATYDGKFLLQ